MVHDLGAGHAHHYLHAINETMCMAYRFLNDILGPLNGFELSNCNVVMMSPDLYVEMIRDYDICCIEYSAKVTGKPPLCFLHHCDVKVESFAEAYRELPGVHTLQASYMSDITRIYEVWPEVKFSAMVSPVDLLNKSESDLFEDIDKCVAAGANDLAIWNIDPKCAPDMLQGLFSKLEDIANKHNRKPVFSVTPFSWEELDWEFPQYRNQKSY